MPSVEVLPRLPVWAGRGSSGGIIKSVSYTHLDVYKRQLLPTWVAEGDLYPDAETPDEPNEKQYDAVSSYWGSILILSLIHI